MIYGWLLRTACFIARTLCIVNFWDLWSRTAWRLPANCLQTACQMPAHCLPAACQLTKDWPPYWFMAGFYTQHVLLLEHCESTTSETFDQGLPDDCQPTAWRLPANCLQTACQLLPNWLKTDCQYGLWLAFTHRMFYCRNTESRSLPSETCDWILPDYCITKDWQLPYYFFLATMGDNHRTYEIL